VNALNAFGSAVHTQGPQGKQVSLGRYAVMCLLESKGRPGDITLQVRAKGNGVTPIAVYETQPVEYPDQLSFDLKVPVTWTQQGEIWIPHTRHQGEKDFMNVLAIDGNLHVSDVQISLLIRRGPLFCVMVQQVYAGWIRVVDNEVRFIPSDPAYAYPGANYQTTWKGRGGVLATMARVVHGVLETMEAPLEEPTPAVWEPRKVKPLNGWKRGHVLFFCPITNTGHILGEDGRTYFLWGNNLVDMAGPVHMLEPMAPVYFRPGEQKEGQSLPPVKSCKPAAA